MPHAKPQELPTGRWPAAGDGFRSEQWGDMEVGYTVVDAPADITELYKHGDFAGNVCMCPHYGYIFEGSVQAVYPDTDLPDEVAVAGEAYFFPAGHVLIYPEPTKALELNPAFALQRCMDSIQQAVEKMSAAAGASAPL